MVRLPKRGPFVKRPGMTTCILLVFLALVVVCDFDGTAAGLAPKETTHGSGSFCTILHGAGALAALPLQPDIHPFSPPTHPGSAVFPSWFMARSIDHPPKRFA
ncbi:MAG: hypothetical protein A2Z31_07520 [candidate division NC10 bacterium RBG_16_65_8]|nr:MAG: hypothetical protein A2Z31_07520 [candidate division NC10 bacterium RBG_16_65_8]